MIRLGVNLDHVATLRNARGEGHPDIVEAARLAERAGADGITAHLREDRRHIRDEDLPLLREAVSLPLNMEMAARDDMVEIALGLGPHACCLVPERREELTTEGGLSLTGFFRSGGENYLTSLVRRFQEGGIRVSLFIDGELDQVEAAARLGADMVEFHVGAYSRTLDERAFEVLWRAAERAGSLGLEVHAGHGINYDSLERIARLPYLAEVNVGHFIIGQSIFEGMEEVIGKMKRILL